MQNWNIFLQNCEELCLLSEHQRYLQMCLEGQEYKGTVRVSFT